MPSVDALHQIATASVNMLLPVKEIHAVQARQLLFSLRYTWSSRLLAAFRPALARKAGELITLEAWLAVMALHEANQARSSHYPQ